MHTAFQVIQLLLSIVLLGILLVQARGQGFSASMGSSDSSIYRTRRGFERTLFNFTIGLAIVWVVVSILTSATY
jgi:preprotein translocase subunit SecG